MSSELADADTSRRIRPFVIFGVVVTAMAMTGLDSSIVATALPTLRNSLHARLNWAGWTITAYQLGLVMTLPIAGRVSDQFGRRRIFLTCLAIFTVSSLLCATAVNIYELVTFRALQAVGGGAFFPSAVGIITDHFGRDRDRAVGMMSGVGPIGVLVGPVLGGVIVAYWSWRGVFLINIPIGVIVFVLAMRFIPHSPPRDAPKADLRGIALLGGVLLPFMYGITTLGEGTTQLTSPQFIVPEAFAIVFGYLFVRHAKVAPAPVIPLRLLYKEGYGRLNIINYFYGGCAIGASALIPLYAEERYRFGSLEAGTVLSARAIGVLSVASITAFLIRRVGYRRPMMLGTFLTTAGMVLVGIGPKGLSTYAWLAMSAAVMGTGIGVMFPSASNAMLHKTIGEVGSISALRQMFQQCGAISLVSGTTAIAARSHHPGIELGHAYIILAIVVTAIVIPLTSTIADHRGRW